jgi:hypothetical protein
MTRHDIARVISLSLCPGLILMTFLTMEVALGANLEALNIDSIFTLGFRRFIHTTMAVPFFLGVLLGHWYHPVPRWFTLLDRRYPHPVVPIVIVLGLTVILLVVGCTISYVIWYSVPSFVNTIMVILGIFVGALIWPVHVFEDREDRIRREGAHEAIHELHSR